LENDTIGFTMVSFLFGEVEKRNQAGDISCLIRLTFFTTSAACTNAFAELQYDREPVQKSRRRLDFDDVGRLGSLGTLADGELNAIPFVQAAIAIVWILNLGKMNEEILAAFALDKSIALGSIKPFDRTGRSLSHSLLAPSVEIYRNPAICKKKKHPGAAFPESRGAL
jgi:hypothetical protein